MQLVLRTVFYRNRNKITSFPVSLDGHMTSSSAGTGFCCGVPSVQGRSGLTASGPCQNSSRTQSSTASARPRCSSGRARWPCWRSFGPSGCTWPGSSSRAGCGAGWAVGDSSASAGPPSPCRDTPVAGWPGGKAQLFQVYLLD